MFSRCSSLVLLLCVKSMYLSWVQTVSSLDRGLGQLECFACAPTPPALQERNKSFEEGAEAYSAPETHSTGFSLNQMVSECKTPLRPQASFP